MIRVRETESGASIELTPIIDMVFLLLIFFLVATSFHQTEREMEIALPAATAAAPISTVVRELIVNVDAAGRLIVSGSPIEPGALREMIEHAVEANPEQKVTVRGDRHTTYDNIVGVLDICKGAGIQEPYLDTVLER